MVLAASRGSDSGSARQALAQLCQTYWFPLYAYARRRGESQHAAEDLTQGFFVSLLARQSLAQVDRQRGKFRAFLLAAFQNFLADEHDRAAAKKRGGDKLLIAFDGLDGETRYHLEPAHELTPEKLFERQWALTLLEQVLARLQHDWVTDGKRELYDLLQGTLTGEPGMGYDAIAERLNMTVAAVKSAAYRLRQRYRELLMEEIRHTVDDPAVVEEEIRYLLSCL